MAIRRFIAEIRYAEFRMRGLPLDNEPAFDLVSRFIVILIRRNVNIVYGIVSIVAGVFLVTVPEFIGSIIPIVVGIAVIISSSFKVQQALVLKNLNSKYFLPSLIIAIVCLVCGVVILFNPFTSAVVVTQIIGLFMIIYAVLDIINSFILRKNSNFSVEISTERKENKSRSKKARTAKVVKEVDREEED